MKLEKWNPSVKMVTILICVLILSFQYNTVLNTTVFAVMLLSLFFFSEVNPGKVAALLVPAGFAALGLFVMGLYYAKGSSIPVKAMADVDMMPYMVRAALSTNLHTALQLATRLLAYAGMGIVFALTTDGEYFVRSLMHQCHLPPKFAYGILAAFYLMPFMARELKNVQLSFRVRNMCGNALHPNVLFTMLVNSVRWSESEAMAMESKGFCGAAKRTYCEIPEIHPADVIIAVLCIGSMVAGIFILGS
ncbi:Energy-coupling factor transporter transmembrane protein EcfT [Lachnospiraceae bacterium]|nr:Energy-coupling factor transporter transmembrane protein EcfT [Lachnospiraceae bacterium]